MATESTPLNDPFAAFDGQRTFVRPNPAAWAAPAPAADAAPGADAAAEAPDHGLNPLLALANRLLLLVPPLRTARQVGDVAALRASLAQGVRDFVAAAQQQGLATERVMAARYVLCTTIDEAAADTPWGGTGVWARHSLLAEFHNEASGGEKVFQLMARLAEKPQANLDLLELIYAAITLGFEGRYRVVDNGKAQLEAVRARLGGIIRQQRGTYPPALAQHWAVPAAERRRALSWLPLALVAASCALLLGLVYTVAVTSLAERADPVHASIQALRLPPPVAAAPQPAPQPRLAVFLAPDIKAGLVAVRDEVDRSVVTLRGDGLFARGSATLLPERQELMRRIADALVRVGGDVLVTGHTDDSPIRSARFPSNWHLSDERARSVRDLIVAAGVPAGRVRAEGQAAGYPVAPNDSESHRALNRRVELTLFTARDAAAARAATPPAPPASR
ncbi:type VI secretion system protein TssL [Rubrivivax gelatinosus]|nr:type VI secretion system protein TssL [Rubrivivax gelatinosus]